MVKIKIEKSHTSSKKKEKICLLTFLRCFYFFIFVHPVFMLWAALFAFCIHLNSCCAVTNHDAAWGWIVVTWAAWVRLLDFQPGGSNRKISGRALDALQRGEQPVGAVPVHTGDLHRLVSLRAEVLQGEERSGHLRRRTAAAAAAADELSLRHQDLPQVYTVHLLCAAETTVPLG